MVIDDLRTDLESLEQRIIDIQEIKKTMPYEKYDERFRDKHVELLKKKWKLRQQLFELIHNDKLNEPEAYIPKRTHYCYGDDFHCPFWQKENNFDHQENGYCYFLKQGDWDNDGLSLIWDMVKQCQVSEYVDSE